MREVLYCFVIGGFFVFRSMVEDGNAILEKKGSLGLLSKRFLIHNLFYIPSNEGIRDEP